MKTTWSDLDRVQKITVEWGTRSQSEASLMSLQGGGGKHWHPLAPRRRYEKKFSLCTSLIHYRNINPLENKMRDIFIKTCVLFIHWISYYDYGCEYATQVSYIFYEYYFMNIDIVKWRPCIIDGMEACSIDSVGRNGTIRHGHLGVTIEVLLYWCQLFWCHRAFYRKNFQNSVSIDVGK